MAGLTLTEIEDAVNDVARQYAREEYGMPARALRVVLFPGYKYTSMVDRGTTAVITIGLLPSDPDFKRALKNAIATVHKDKAWESMEVEKRTVVQTRDWQVRRNLWKLMGFDPDALGKIPRDVDCDTKVITRVEVTHRKSGMREVMEYESGMSVLAAERVAHVRLARRIMLKHIVEESPWELPPEHPDWIARTA